MSVFSYVASKRFHALTNYGMQITIFSYILSCFPQINSRIILTTLVREILRADFARVI